MHIMKPRRIENKLFLLSVFELNMKSVLSPSHSNKITFLIDISFDQLNSKCFMGLTIPKPHISELMLKFKRIYIFLLCLKGYHRIATLYVSYLGKMMSL